MEIAFKDKSLERLYTDKAATSRLPDAVVTAFRRRLQSIRAAHSTLDFRNNKGMHFERLKGQRQHQHSIRLNDQFRLVLELQEKDGRTIVLIVSVEDYH